MIEIIVPPGDLCAGQAYEIEAIGAEACRLVNWRAASVPAGVSPDDVVFQSPGALITNVTVPTPGAYSFIIECLQP